MLHGFATAGLIARYARCLFDINPHFFRLGIDQTVNHALLDNGVGTWSQTSTQENISDVTTTTFGAIQEIFRLAIPVDLTAYGQLVIGIIGTAELAIGIFKAQFYTGNSHRFTFGRSGKNHILHAAAP